LGVLSYEILGLAPQSAHCVTRWFQFMRMREAGGDWHGAKVANWWLQANRQVHAGWMDDAIMVTGRKKEGLGCALVAQRGVASATPSTLGEHFASIVSPPNPKA